MNDARQNDRTNTGWGEKNLLLKGKGKISNNLNEYTAESITTKFQAYIVLITFFKCLLYTMEYPWINSIREELQ